MKCINCFNNLKKQNQGFTLVELLVVISIISLLSSMGMVALNSARVKARDALRMGQMAQLRTALAFYYDDHNAYPKCGDGDMNNPPSFGVTADTGCQCYLSMEGDLSQGPRPIMTNSPRDPMNIDNKITTNGTYNFRYVSNVFGDEYALVYTLEEGGVRYIRGW